MKPNSLTILAALVLIAVGGFMAGRISSGGLSTNANDTNTIDSKISRSATSTSGEASSQDARKAAHPGRPDRTAPGTAAERLSRLEAIIRGEDPLDRNRALLAYLDQLAPGDFEAAVARFRSLGITESRYGEYAMLLSAWAKIDPLAALTYAQANTRNPFATNTILASWASSDPEGAIRWAETHHQGDGANPYLAGIIRSIAGSDPVRATQLLTSMPRSQERGEALDAMIPHLLTQGPEAARSWIAALTDEALRDGAMTRAAEPLAAIDPAATAAWLAAHPGQAADRRMDDVYAAWAGQDLQAAQNSLATLSEGANRSNALRGIISNVAITDPQAALTLMNRYPSDVTDRVVKQFIWHSFGTDPSVAVNQIARIADEGQRNQMYSHTIDAWLQKDPNAANSWMRSNPLPPAVQSQLNPPR